MRSASCADSASSCGWWRSAEVNRRAAFSGCSRSCDAAARKRVLLAFAASAWRLACSCEDSASRNSLRALRDALLERLVRLAQRVLGALVVGDVAERRQVAAAGQRFAARFDDAAVRPFAHEHMRRAAAQKIQAAAHLLLDVAGPEQAALRVVANQVGDRPADVDEAFRVVEQIRDSGGSRRRCASSLSTTLMPWVMFWNVTPISSRLKRSSCEVSSSKRRRFGQVQAGAAQRARQHAPRRRRADRAGQQALGELQQRAVGRRVRQQASGPVACA